MNTYSTVFDEKLKIWSGIKKPVLYSNNASVGQIILTSLYRSPDAIGQICHDDGSTMTNGEILRDAIRASLNLQDLGLKQGDVIGVIAKNHKNLTALVVGALLNGNPINTLDPSFDLESIYYTFNTSQPKVVLCNEDKIADVQTAFDRMDCAAKLFVFGQGGNGFQCADHLLKPHLKEELYTPPEVADPARLPAVILCSSGTTAAPKSIMISHAAIAYCCLQSFDIRAGSRVFNFSSLYWITAWYTILGSLYWNGVRIITTQKATPKLLVEIIRTHQINLLYTPPAHLALLLKEDNLIASDFDSVKNFICGGSNLSLGTGIKINSYLRNGSLFNVYGLTEMGGVTSMTKFKDKVSCGKLSPGIQIKIIDDNDNHLGVGEMGEVCIKTPVSQIGYYKNEKETRNTYKNGWIHSGDVGYFDEENDLHIVDRKKDILRITRGYSSYQMNPSEIEAVILEIEDIVMAAVVGVPDLLNTELVSALVVKREGSPVTESQIIDHVKSKLVDHKWLYGGVFFTNKLPLTVTGKVKKREVKEILTNLFKIAKTG